MVHCEVSPRWRGNAAFSVAPREEFPLNCPVRAGSAHLRCGPVGRSQQPRPVERVEAAPVHRRLGDSPTGACWCRALE